MMELGLSLGDHHDHTEKPFKFMEKSQNMVPKDASGLGFCMGLDTPSKGRCKNSIGGDRVMSMNIDHRGSIDEEERLSRGGSSDPVLHLLPFSPAKPKSQLPFPWLNSNANVVSEVAGKGAGFNWQPLAAADDEADEGVVTVSSPNSAVSSFQMDFRKHKRGRNKRDFDLTNLNGGNSHHHHHQEVCDTNNSTKCANSDDEDINGLLGRKKLRLTKEQSAFLETSFKEQHTLTPKQKIALAKQLNLRPRQVEVWFQNRRARTKLKQTEVDCEYLKRCCETLTEENKRLQKEVQELRALKSSKPFYMQLPATTLTMCPSCERVASSTATTANVAAVSAPAATVVTTKQPRLHPFLQDQVLTLQASS